jgi:chloramphenicol 3-O phosphotransferase
MLNGPSSAGKTSVALALQELMETPYMRMGVDDFTIALPPGLLMAADEAHAESPEYMLLVYRSMPGLGEEPTPGGRLFTELRIGPGGIQLFAAMYHALAAIAKQGINLIVDSVIFDGRVLREAILAFHDLPVLFVGLRVPREVAERRERARSDRDLGTAAAHYDRVHAHGLYDLEFDTSLITSMECALQIKRALVDGHPRTAFGQLATALDARAEGGATS